MDPACLASVCVTFAIPGDPGHVRPGYAGHTGVGVSDRHRRSGRRGRQV